MPVVLPPNLAVDGCADRKVISVEPTRVKGYGQVGRSRTNLGPGSGGLAGSLG